MLLFIDEELLTILSAIRLENKSLTEWREIESGDMYQSSSYCGGFDADEDSFNFSYFTPKGQEYWFDISLKEVVEIIEGRKMTLQLREVS